MKKWILISLVLVFFASLAGANYLGFFSPSFSSLVQKPIQRIDLVDLEGNTHSFDELEGRETVIYFFASWCSPCFKTLATLEQLSNNQTLKVNLLAVALDEDIDGIHSMLNKTSFSGTVWIASEGTMALQKRYFGNENRAVPYVVKLDESTNLIESSYKLNNRGQWESVLVNGMALNSVSSL